MRSTRHGLAVNEAVAGRSSPIPADIRSGMEQRFGSGFGQVRIHAGASADRAARSVGAAAFTVGNDVVFRAGMFAPRTRKGAAVLAHELAHVVQQRNARGPVALGEDTGLEREAHAAAIDPSLGAPRGRSARLRLQRLELTAAMLSEVDIDPREAVTSPDFIDNSIASTALREASEGGGIRFVSYTVLYRDGSAVDIPINAQWMRAPRRAGEIQIIRYRRHPASGKIFPLVWRGTPAQLPDTGPPSGEIFVAADVTRNILRLYDIDLVIRASQFARDIMAIWAAGLFAASAIQVFSAVQIAALRSAGAASIRTAASAAALRTEAQRILAEAERRALIQELRAAGVRFTESNIVRIFRTATGRIAWIETGTEQAGLRHIMQRHGAQFAQLGVRTEQEVAELVERTLATKVPVRAVGTAGGGDFAGVLQGGRDLRIVVGNNGFVVTAHPL